MPEIALPAPPNGESRWSIVTLAQYLCVTPAAVDGRLTVEAGKDSPDLTDARLHVWYRDKDGDSLGDAYLCSDAAERIADELPIGLLARRVLADDPEMAALLGWDQIYAMARHIVELADGSVA